MPRPATLRVVALFTAALVIAACSDDPTAPIPTATGRVTVSATGDPIAGAKVSIGDITATTDADGRFELSGLVEGPATIRGTATGFDQFEADISVPSGAITRNIAMNRIELFELGDFTLQIAATVSKARGILVALGGPDTRGFASGAAFGAPLPQVEASLQTFGQQLRALAASRGLAILGTSRAAMANGASSDQAILQAIQQAAAMSGREDLVSAPFLVYGMSGGGPEAAGFVARNASRIAGLFLKAPLSVESVTSGPALGVPTYVVLAELDVFIDNTTIKSAYSANRGAGAQWALASEIGVPHHSLSPAQRDLTADWMNTILGMRLGNAPSDPLRAITESSGWLGEPVNAQVMSWDNYSGDRRTASWFPSQATAEKWRTFVRTGMP
jgi:hypothetical protein